MIIPFPSGISMDWYVIRAATRREVDVVEALWKGKEGVGYAAYLPQGVRWHRFRRSEDKDKDRVYYPLFPGYLFVECPREAFDDILAIQGVHDFLRVPDTAGKLIPMPVSARLVEGISNEEGRGVFDVTRPTKRERERAERIAKGYEPGEMVVITDGPFSGFMSTVIRMSHDNRKAVINGPTGALTIDAMDLELAA